MVLLDSHHSQSRFGYTINNIKISFDLKQRFDFHGRLSHFENVISPLDACFPVCIFGFVPFGILGLLFKSMYFGNEGKVHTLEYSIRTQPCHKIVS